MFTPPFDANGKPLYPEMTKDAVLFGGTDPGRFCPTYMIFADSFTDGEDLPAFDQKFDRRDVYIITQNALADGTYLNYIRAHYNRSTQVDPPFFQELARSTRERELNYSTNMAARLMRPLDSYFTGLGDRIEKRRRTYTSWFEPSHFTDFASFKARLQPNPQQDPVSKFIYENLSSDARQALASSMAEKELRKVLARELNVLLDRELTTRKQLNTLRAKKFDLEQEIGAGKGSDSKRKQMEDLDKEIAKLNAQQPFYTADRFKGVTVSDYLAEFIKENPQSHTRVRLNRLLLEAAYPKEIQKTKGGVYPDREIYIPSPEDSQRCFQEYLSDAQRRLQMNPPQLKPGEDVRLVDNRVQVSGQVAVMAINGLLTKVIFDNNPKNEFFVEESFPLEWMYPYLTPFGIIMKINRQPLPELTEEIVKRDHDFWSQYSNRLIGNWITYDTPVKDIAAFVEKVYLRKDFSGFTGDRKFVRDDQAQKAFSKLRSSIGGVYAWRISDPNNRDPIVQQRMIKEADFAFRQAFAFCPYSPEAVFRYVNLLLSMNRIEDAIIVASTCQKLDPFNGQVIDLLNRLRSFRQQQGDMTAPPQDFARLEQAARDNPGNAQMAVEVARHYMTQQQPDRAAQALDRVLAQPQVDAPSVLMVAQAYATFGNFQKLESTLERLVQVTPDSPEAFYDLGALRATMGKTNEAVAALRQAITLSKARQAKDSKARDLRVEAQKDPRLTNLKAVEGFQALLEGK
jgi:tetratricopeptide (TPR) repeat protein